MKKSLIFIGLFVLAAASVVFALKFFRLGGTGESLAASPKDATYIIDGRAVTLVDGFSETEEAAGAASKITTRYFGNEATLDLDGDGREDAVFLLTQETAGTGLFFYAVAALNTAEGYVGSSGAFLGDRIAPQVTEIQGDVIVVNFAERAPGEPMTARPSVGKSVRLRFDPQARALREAGLLEAKTWAWVSTLYNDGTKVEPREPGKFTLTFSGDGRFSATTDCNSMGGSYEAGEGAISFGPIAMTKMYCEGSQEADFAATLEKAQIYHFTPEGELVFDLRFDSGVAVFR